MTSLQPTRESANDPIADDSDAALADKLGDAGTPGFEAEFDPDEAERAGAFAEDAMSAQDAAESTADLVDVGNPDEGLQLAFITDTGPATLPDFISTTNSADLFGRRPGESVPEAAARAAKER